MSKNITVIILAAGKGERMRSDLPKVLHPICGRPMFLYTLDLVKSLKIKNVIVVLGHKHREVVRLLSKNVKVVLQKRLLGTADAVKCTKGYLRGFKGSLLILYADHALFKRETISKLVRHHIKNNLDATLLTAVVNDPVGYGRILRDRGGVVSGVVEENKANDFQKDIKEINLGASCFDKEKLFDALRYIKADNPKKEYYLTESIGVLYKRDVSIEAIRISDIDEAMGINHYPDLVKANRLMRKRIHENLMKQGVRVFDPDSTFIDWDVKIGQNTTIYPFTVIERDVKIGKNCSIGPFTHLRPGTVIKDNVILGNFVELVRSDVGKRCRVKHFSYLGDSRIGSYVNIGAGSVTANFDGKKKSVTVIKDRAFIGSDTILIAPVKVGKSAVTGAGSVITKDNNVPDRGVVVGVPAKILKKRSKR